MNNLISKFNDYNISEITSNKDLVTFYSICKLFHLSEINEFERIYIREYYESCLAKTKLILKDHKFIIYPEMNVIQFKMIDDNLVNNKLRDVREYVTSKHDKKDINYYLELGFWFNNQNFEIFQISQCYSTLSL